MEYIFDGLKNMHEIYHSIEANKFRKTDASQKVNIPRTEVSKPAEIKYNTKIDSFIKKD